MDFQVTVQIPVCLQLQEQLDRFMKMNAELRHKQSVLQAQLKSIVERKADMEADLKEKNKEIENLQAQLETVHSSSTVGIPLYYYTDWNIDYIMVTPLHKI